MSPIEPSTAAVPSRRRPRSRIRKPAGFTTIELMVVIAIMAILAALALPSFSGTIERYRVRQGVEDLSASIFLARSEAVRRGGGVVLTATNSPGCEPDDGSDWHCGWKIFVDLDNDGKQGTSDVLIRATVAPSGLSAVLTNGSALKFNRWGDFVAAGNNFQLRPASKAAEAADTTLICLSSGGRVKIVPRTLQCSGSS